MMLYTSPQLCAIMLGVIPPVAAWGVFFGRRVSEDVGEWGACQSLLNYTMDWAHSTASEWRPRTPTQTCDKTPSQWQVRALSKNMADELAAAGTIAEERVANIRAVRALGNDTLEVAR